jgi:hypothetical protein
MDREEITSIRLLADMMLTLEIQMEIITKESMEEPLTLHTKEQMIE